MKKRILLFSIVTVLLLSILSSSAVYAQTASREAVGAVHLSGIMSENLAKNHYRQDKWGDVIRSYLVENPNKTLTRVECIYDKDTKTEKLTVEDYSFDGDLLNRRIIPSELPLFGGYFCGKAYNFFVFGQENMNKSDDREVIRIVKYSKDWRRLGSDSLSAVNTAIPFDGGTLRMTEYGNSLYAHTCREMYNGHQANLNFVYDESADRVTDVNFEIANIGWKGYVSHSFNQFIETDGKELFRVDHGDAYPRAVSIVKTDLSGKLEDVKKYTEVIDLSKTGSTGQNWTGLSLGGFALTADSCIMAGCTVDYTSFDTDSDRTKNIFLSVTDKALSSSSVQMLTHYTANDGITVYNPHFVKLREDRFLLLWEEHNDQTQEYRTKMMTADAQGEPCSKIVSCDYALSDCDPILCSDGLVRWYTGTGYSLKLYTVDPDNLSLSENGESIPSELENTDITLTLQIGDVYPIDYLGRDEDAHIRLSMRGNAVTLDQSHNYDIVAKSLGEATVTITVTRDRSQTVATYRITVQEEVPYITLNLHPMIDDTVNRMRFKAGNPIGVLPEPEWDGHLFLGWFTAAEGGETVGYYSTFTQNTSIYAHWKETVIPTEPVTAPSTEPETTPPTPPATQPETSAPTAPPTDPTDTPIDPSEMPTDPSTAPTQTPTYIPPIDPSEISTEAPSVTSFMFGDVDGDGKVTIVDVTAIQRRLASIPTAFFNERAADIMGDGIDITDATYIQKHLAHLPCPDNIGKTVSY